jgi:hypothetical protein
MVGRWYRWRGPELDVELCHDVSLHLESALN